jgi:hypothetical protein
LIIKPAGHGKKIVAALANAIWNFLNDIDARIALGGPIAAFGGARPAFHDYP